MTCANDPGLLDIERVEIEEADIVRQGFERTYDGGGVRLAGQYCEQVIPANYEFVAVRSERLPTITDLVKSLPLVASVTV
ncbi:MAG TPA: hypothetical protein VFG94_02600, partial [Acidimicrobiales bacterium]|nr:hypothetical protein [Acidimicrobiales bacterium]